MKLKRKYTEACSSAILDLYPKLRCYVLDAFEKQPTKLTKTQQAVILSVSEEGDHSISSIAKGIHSSNEQTSRVAAQLIESGLLVRMQNSSNHRVVNLKLSEKGQAFLDDVKGEIAKQLEPKHELHTDSEVSELCDGILALTREL